MQYLIINADDLGMNHQVNIAIEKVINESLVTSSTIMANGDAFEEAVAIALRNPGATYGVHLCIDQMAPLTNSDVFKKNGMVDEEGKFIQFAYLHINRTKEIKEAIYNEWKAQIKKVLDAGITITHMDSHHHAHCNPFLTPIYIRLAREFNIKKLRLAMFIPPKVKLREKKAPVVLKTNSQSGFIKNGSRARLILLSIKAYIELYNANRLIKRKFDTTDFFCSYRYYLNNQELLKEYQTIELMTHPGHPSYQEETEQLVMLKSIRDVELKKY